MLDLMLALPSSLERALSVAKDKHLNSYMRRVRIFVDRFHLSVLQDQSLFREAGMEATARNTEIERQLRSKRVAMYSTWVKDQSELERTEKDEAKIQDIFDTLCSLPKIQMTVLDLDWVRGRGYDIGLPKDLLRLKAAYNGERPMWPGWRNDRPLQTILKAIEMSGLTLSSLKCVFNKYGIPSTMFIPETGFWQIAENLRGVKVLSFTMQAVPEGANSHSGPVLIAHFVAFLKMYTSSMEHLHLDADSEEDTCHGYCDLGAVFNAMKANLFFPCLKALYVHLLKAKYQDFISYLGAHEATIRSYGLEGCAFFDAGTELTGKAFEKQVANDLKAAGLPKPETC